MSDLEDQIKAEADEIANAPRIEPLPPVGRCGWCGKLAANLYLVEVTHGQERFKCDRCMAYLHD